MQLSEHVKELDKPFYKSVSVEDKNASNFIKKAEKLLVVVA